MQFSDTLMSLRTIRFPLVLVLTAGLLAGCGEQRIDDYNDVSFDLVDQNGEQIRFPDYLRGKPVLMGFVYTYCPDICSFITANLYDVWSEMGEPDDVEFVIVTFDPQRDTPEVLRDYAAGFGMDRPPFRFLTGPEEEIEAMMERVGVRSNVSYTSESEDGEEFYFLNHTDKVLLIDSDGRLVYEYGGSMTPTDIFREDLEKLL